MEHDLPGPEEIAALPADGGPHFNRLIFEKSPYLLQHAANPVDWYPWGEEALRRAREEDRLIFLSIGYASCHWCHRMAQESFASPEVAEVLGASYIAIKVDKEERPDLDLIYMHASHLLTGSGGWPNSLWLTPALEPWYAGTYFPREDHEGRAGFQTHLRLLAEMWEKQRSKVEDQAHRVTEALRQAFRPPAAEEPVPLRRALIDHALHHAVEGFDAKHGGFGEAPKFPPHNALRFLLYEAARSADPQLERIIVKTLDAMRWGGLRDHLGGGFHRYCLGAHWIVPHFEKMLYDNAQLLRSYTDALLLTGNEEYREVARETAEWALREMRVAEGGFASAQDADSEGQEGKFYVWRREEVLETLGPEEGELFCRVYHVQPRGNYLEESSGERTGTNVLYVGESWAAVAEREGLDEGELQQRLAAARERLFTARRQRVPPALDDKVQTAGNGLLLGALAHAGHVLEEPAYVAAAGQAADFLLTALQPEGRLHHTWRAGEARVPAFLDDYACLADGLLDLYEATGDAVRLEQAEALTEEMLGQFTDRESGCLYFTAADGEPLLVRPLLGYDESTPSGNAVAAGVLLRLAEETGEPRYREALGRLLSGWAASLQATPTAMLSMMPVLSAWLGEEEGA